MTTCILVRYMMVGGGLKNRMSETRANWKRNQTTQLNIVLQQNTTKQKSCPLFSETLDPKSFDTLHSMRIYLNMFLLEVKLTYQKVMAPLQGCKQGLWEDIQ